MNFLFDKSISRTSSSLEWQRRSSTCDELEISQKKRPLEIAVVNNMPDSALHATEKQFGRLLAQASPEHSVRVTFYSLPSVIRSGAAEQKVQDYYGSLNDLKCRPIDGLIVTGAEPRAAHLRDEPFWAELADLIDWAAVNTRSTVWSCLAAHAAVLHLDNIERRRLPVKKSGIFSCDLNRSHWITQNFSSALTVSHSRWNELAQEDLERSGYLCVTTSRGAGIDIFTKSLGSEFIFFQGHPEYDSRSLQYEFLRDFGRYLNGEQANLPLAPSDYFDHDTEARLSEIRAMAQAMPDGRYHGDRPATQVRPGIEKSLSNTAEGLFSNWIQNLSRY